MSFRSYGAVTIHCARSSVGWLCREWTVGQWMVIGAGSFVRCPPPFCGCLADWNLRFVPGGLPGVFGM
ncbi:hypothetical protein ATK36_0352 [Amycolatopsis sulphurea]|uniref:Uncharacterized protein n=1 Tax=Amycolatopsis sulphurea TaxID=76022 RepID=A0A2A9G1N4_9PSEU|nr:hypothetical protein ATK36_0352 [Amycolatopsis sulphurea]